MHIGLKDESKIKLNQTAGRHTKDTLNQILLSSTIQTVVIEKKLEVTFTFYVLHMHKLPLSVMLLVKPYIM